MTEALEYLTVKEVCALLRLSERTVYGLIKQGELPHVKLGAQIRINREELSAYIRSKSNV